MIDKCAVLQYLKARALDFDALNTILLPLMKEPAPTFYQWFFTAGGSATRHSAAHQLAVKRAFLRTTSTPLLRSTSSVSSSIARHADQHIGVIAARRLFLDQKVDHVGQCLSGRPAEDRVIKSHCDVRARRFGAGIG